MITFRDVIHRITLGKTCFGIVSDGSGRVVRAAPMARWANGRLLKGVLGYYLKRGAKVELVADPGLEPGTVGL